ncbi:DUF1810 family protein [Legionella maioricensis]|uniref:DUF1810 family protein n=1 Tax=Legionella maioricensis TaxID=2896528 RepID=A0A9X2D0X3_9GAMM|nr:DUF1810 family protein [Legionella maioricensis]MCL9683832.1 DUF1810 family protein [Legionella maioricensis]MCL9686679.1 DUF1810 family protein [Legionella maioricensis]
MSDLDRFRDAQLKEVDGYAQAEREITAGKKRTHWIWYILPQLGILGFSAPSQYYGIANFEEACDYLRDETLFKNYYKIIKIIESQLSSHPNLRLDQLMGQPDDLKLLSSLTLFREAASFLDSQITNPKNDFKDLKIRCDHIFALVAKQHYYPCMQTESYLQSASRPSITIKPQEIKTPPAKPSVVRPKTTFFEPPVIHTPPIPDVPLVVHTLPIPDKNPVVPDNTALDAPPVIPIKTEQDEISAPLTPVEDTEPEVLSPLIPSLEGYIEMRRNEWSFHYNFLGVMSLIYLIMDAISGSDHFHEKNRDVKISAATKLKQLLDPTAPQLNAPLTSVERAALSEGRLGGLVAEHGSLEQLIQNAPEKQIIEDNSIHPFNF